MSNAHSTIASHGTPGGVALWGGRVLSGLVLAFLAFDLALKLLELPIALEATTQLGYAASSVRPIGVVALVCWILHAIPRTAVVGAILWTGYLGGAIATHVRAQSPLLSHALFPLLIAALIWGGLLLRRPALLRALLGRPHVSDRG
jgi:hypothetical protein